MGSGIRAEVSLPAGASSPFEVVVDGSTPVYSVARSAPNDGAEAAGFEFIADAGLSVTEGVDVVFDYGPKTAYRFEAVPAEDSPFAVLDRHGLAVTELTIRDGGLVVTLHATDLPALRSTFSEHIAAAQRKLLSSLLD